MNVIYNVIYQNMIYNIIYCASIYWFEKLFDHYEHYKNEKIEI